MEAQQFQTVEGRDEVYVYHVTAKDNVESIQEEGLIPSPSIAMDLDFVYVTPSKDDAQDVVNAYYNGDKHSVAVFRARVMEGALMEDPDPCGDLNSYAHEGHIYPVDIEQVAL